MIVGLTAGVFYRLTTSMIDIGTEAFGRKIAYQQTQEALENMAGEIRYSLRGGAEHNLSVAGPASVWQYHATDYCTNQQFALYPDPNDFQRRVTFQWVNSADYAGSFPPGFTLMRQEGTDRTALAVVPAASQGTLEVRYYDNSGSLIPAAGGLTHAQAQTVNRIALILTVTQRGEPITLSQVIFIRQKGLPPQEAGAI